MSQHNDQPHALPPRELPEFLQREADHYRALKRKRRRDELLFVATVAVLVMAAIIGSAWGISVLWHHSQDRAAMQESTR